MRLPRCQAGNVANDEHCAFDRLETKVSSRLLWNSAEVQVLENDCALVQQAGRQRTGSDAKDLGRVEPCTNQFVFAGETVVDPIRVDRYKRTLSQDSNVMVPAHQAH